MSYSHFGSAREHDQERTIEDLLERITVLESKGATRLTESLIDDNGFLDIVQPFSDNEAPNVSSEAWDSRAMTENSITLTNGYFHTPGRYQVIVSIRLVHPQRMTTWRTQIRAHSETSGVKLISRSSGFSFRGNDVDLQWAYNAEPHAIVFDVEKAGDVYLKINSHYSFTAQAPGENLTTVKGYARIDQL